MFAGTPADFARIIQILSPDGRWPDIDYTHQNRLNWSPAQHLTRLAQLTVLCAADAAPVTRAIFKSSHDEI
ncbi:hypothetical protein [Geminisphaera colitermitum]|uniref:hypothetical protein n=1 Tax=Geminisphaera colitermitum TaxID=1148786 RepID=UPI000158C867|nr:hypothetical protein [Geminisphaera colitermitum]